MSAQKFDRLFAPGAAVEAYKNIVSPAGPDVTGTADAAGTVTLELTPGQWAVVGGSRSLTRFVPEAGVERYAVYVDETGELVAAADAPVAPSSGGGGGGVRVAVLSGGAALAIPDNAAATPINATPANDPTVFEVSGADFPALTEGSFYVHALEDLGGSTAIRMYPSWSLDLATWTADLGNQLAGTAGVRRGTFVVPASVQAALQAGSRTYWRIEASTTLGPGIEQTFAQLAVVLR